jgi:endonuclease-3
MKNKVINVLNEMFAVPRCELEYSSVFELLVAVILSAQCTDKRVNQVTKVLFEKYNTPQDFVDISTDELEKIIFSCGFYRAKAKAIKEASKDILEKFNGQVPSDFDNLCSLRGVGRKTANVMISEGFKGDAFAVDTHVLRVSNRLGLAKTKNPDKCEFELKKHFDKKDWSRLHYQMVLFGRYFCKAGKPNCGECKLRENCKYFKDKE